MVVPYHFFINGEETIMPGAYELHYSTSLLKLPFFFLIFWLDVDNFGDFGLSNHLVQGLAGAGSMAAGKHTLTIVLPFQHSQTSRDVELIVSISPVASVSLALPMIAFNQVGPAILRGYQYELRSIRQTLAP